MELRWLKKKPPYPFEVEMYDTILQYRTKEIIFDPSLSTEYPKFEWSEWKDVPTEQELKTESHDR